MSLRPHRVTGSHGAHPRAPLSAPALTSEGRWLVRVAQTEDSPVDVNLDAAAAWGGPVATHPRAPFVWQLPSLFESQRDIPRPGTVTEESAQEAGPWQTAAAGRSPALLACFRSAAPSCNKLASVCLHHVELVEYYCVPLGDSTTTSQL